MSNYHFNIKKCVRIMYYNMCNIMNTIYFMIIIVYKNVK